METTEIMMDVVPHDSLKVVGLVQEVTFPLALNNLFIGSNTTADV